jgi:2-polyprenyl-3-methyl-5-hydroxy-6-metoxy-1,4-benzoquinol methylase
MTDYDKQYKESPNVCGPPFADFVAFFENYKKSRANVLDLGCGQGRDALFIARMGHRVVGVDISETGIRQMLDNANKENIDVHGVVADIVTYEPSGEYDVIILDRVLHMIREDHDRQTVLEKASEATKSDGFILIADTPKHHNQIRLFFEHHSASWTTIKDKKGKIFVKKLIDK